LTVVGGPLDGAVAPGRPRLGLVVVVVEVVVVVVVASVVVVVASVVVVVASVVVVVAAVVEQLSDNPTDNCSTVSPAESVPVATTATARNE
jgi:hypothetical protein